MRRLALPVAALLTALGLALVAAPATAQPLPEDRLAADLREEVRRLDVTVKDLYGREEKRSIALTVFRPAGPGPFPLAILSHGRATNDRRGEQGRQRFELQARWLVDKGFAVLVPTRVGYGDTYGDFDPEDSGPCNTKRYEPMAQAAADQVLAALAHARTQRDIDAARWIKLGVSVGGLTTLAVASRNPPGLVAAINFAGGAGGNPEERPGNPCSPAALERLWRTQAATAPVPTLWIYWTHDRYWGEQIPRRWAEAWKEGGGQVEFQHLGPWPLPAAAAAAPAPAASPVPTRPVDGHNGIGADMDRWVPLAETFLARAGFTQSGLVPRPPASGFARVEEIEKVPVTPQRREQLYRAFLQAPSPRAFAISPSGVAAWASGDWALGRALGRCQWRDGQRCKLYAVDNDVVWTP
jgi:dienelactone hydrolase